MHTPIGHQEMPKGAIRLLEVGEDLWRFEFPRLDERVFDLFSEVMDLDESGASGRARKELRLLLEGYPEFLDAYQLLGSIHSTAGRDEQATKTWIQGLDVALAAFPEGFQFGRSRIPWSMMENRPFLRLCQTLGFDLLERGDVPGALLLFETILSLNPNDNQGIRGAAIDCHFTLGQPELVLSLCREYPHDALEHVLYGRALALYQMGKEKAARGALRRAIATYPRVAKELVKKTHRPPKELMPDRVTHGGQDQAYHYWFEQGHHWKLTPGALAFVAEGLASLTKPPDPQSKAAGRGSGRGQD